MLINKSTILQSLNINYPIMKEWKINLHKPIGLVFPSIDKMIEFIELLSGNPGIIDDTTPIEDIEKMLYFKNSEAVVWLPNSEKYYKSKSQAEKESLILNAAMYGKFKGIESKPVIYIGFVKIIPEKYRDLVLPIFIDKDDQILELASPPEILPAVEDLSQIKERIPFGEIGLPLKAACAFLYPYLLKTDSIDKEKDLKLTVKNIMREASEYSQNQDLRDQIVSLLIEAVKEDVKIIELREAEEDDFGSFENVIYAKENGLFLSSNTFNKLISPFSKEVPINILKSKLLEEQIIKGDSDSYTTKMTYKKNGFIKKKRMVYLNINVKEIYEEF